MTFPTLARPASAWRFLADAAAALTSPRADAAACDARVAAIVADSRMCGFLRRASMPWRAAARESRVARGCSRLYRNHAEAPLLVRLRELSGIVAVASIVVLALRFLSSDPEPLTWVLPLVAAVGSGAAWVAARPGRAGDRRRT
jgi:hypothetical protein